jgi:hypothetical protein
MGRKRIGAEPLTGAEKQKRHREKVRAEMEDLRSAVQFSITETAPDTGIMREQIKAELKTSWEPELKAERIAAERKRGRELAKKADQTYTQGRTVGLCNAAAFFIGRDRADIAQSLLSHFMIDRETARAALEADRRTKDLTFSMLENSGAWGKPPKVIK